MCKKDVLENDKEDIYAVDKILLHLFFGKPHVVIVKSANQNLIGLSAPVLLS